MELKFKMSQSDKIGGVFTSKKKGVNFQLAAKIELTEEEAALCENYMIINDRLARWQYGIGEGDFEIIRLNELVNGRSFSVDSLGSIIELKDLLIDGAKGIANYIAVARQFDGLEVIQISSLGE